MSEKPDIPLIKRQVEAQIAEYAAAVDAYAAFMESWWAREADALAEKAAAE